MRPSDSPFPKRCACGATYESPEQWGQLDYVGLQDDGEEVIELRNCACRSTIGVALGSSPDQGAISSYARAVQEPTRAEERTAR